uniref:hypothetical protein n=1 Tax=Klebsiella pneumoniae TaxID=573 RepID=UPI001D0D90AB
KITQLDKENNTLEHFRCTLSEIAAEKKLVFIIDELDRADLTTHLNYLKELNMYLIQRIYSSFFPQTKNNS